MGIIGINTIGGTNGAGLGANDITLFGPFPGGDGTLTDLNVYLWFWAGGGVDLGIYEDVGGVPDTGNLVAHGTVASPAANAWNSITGLSATVSSAKSYWIAIESAGTIAPVNSSTGSNGFERHVGTNTYGNWPSTCPSTTSLDSTNHYSAYGTFTPTPPASPGSSSCSSSSASSRSPSPSSSRSSSSSRPSSSSSPSRSSSSSVCPCMLSPSTLPHGQVGVNYSQLLTPVGCKLPVNMILTGSLPPGLIFTLLPGSSLSPSSSSPSSVSPLSLSPRSSSLSSRSGSSVSLSRKRGRVPVGLFMPGGGFP